MKYKTVIHIAAVALALLLTHSTSWAQLPVGPGDSVRVSPSAQLRHQRALEMRAFDYYTNGLISDELGDFYHAARAYRAALDFFPESVEIGYSLAPPPGQQPAPRSIP